MKKKEIALQELAPVGMTSYIRSKQYSMESSA